MGIGYICKSRLAQKSENYFYISVKDCRKWVYYSHVINHAPNYMHFKKRYFCSSF